MKLNFLKRLLKCKFTILLPETKEIMIYDRLSLNSGIPFEIDKVNIIDTRLESINLTILFFTFLKNRFKNFKINYITNFIKICNPKIVYTGIDNDINFYFLKSVFNKPVYISFQNGLRNNDFFLKSLKIKQKLKKNLTVDYLFCFSEIEKRRLSQIINGNIIVAGHFNNNKRTLNLKNDPNNIQNIVFISSGFFDEALNRDKQIFKHLNNYCKNKKLKLFFLTRPTCKGEKNIRKIFSQGNWTYIPYINTEETYKILNNHNMFVFSHSTLGYEAFAKNKRIAVFNENFPIIGFDKKYENKGFYWTKDFSNYNNFKIIMDNVLNCDLNEWKKIQTKYASDFLTYNPDNKELYKIINQVL